MTHSLTRALQQASRIRQRCALKETHVYVRSEDIDVAEGRISQTRNRTAIMQKLSNFISASPHHLKPLVRDGSQFTVMPFYPRIDSGVSLHSAVKSQQLRSHHRYSLLSKSTITQDEWPTSSQSINPGAHLLAVSSR
jgi:hypothetical protein